jgi:YrbI family 3-deoxy-D-manno-octulosonate 8-phosphate phosphatase
MAYKNVAFIPLRAGSKSIPNKNIKPMNGRPLVYWVLDPAVKCEYIDKIFVSTDGQVIKQVVEEYDSDKVIVIGRSEETARDESSTESAMLEFAEKYEFENIVLIQATSPLLEKHDLDKGFELFFSGKYDSVLSAVRQKRFIWTENEEGSYSPQNYDVQRRPRRQEFEGFFVENGAFYITSKQRLVDTKCRISGRIGLVEMAEESYFEIDSMHDWNIVEILLRRIKSVESNEMHQSIKNIKLVITDSDGVLTDGGMYYSEDGNELKKFNTKDGMAVQLLNEIGVKTVIITGESLELISRRGKKLNVDGVYLGIKEKARLVKKLAEDYNIELSEIAYIGDDINDLESIKMVGFGCSVSDGISEVKEAARYVTKAKGGEGALREVADLIIKAKTYYSPTIK